MGFPVAEQSPETGVADGPDEVVRAVWHALLQRVRWVMEGGAVFGESAAR